MSLEKSFNEEPSCQKIKQAIILAGGQGIRLRPFTDNLPKPMVSINGKPFLEYLVELLKESGVEEIVMLLGYLPEKITEYFGDGLKFGIRIKYSIGTAEDKTGTRIRNAASLLADKFLLMYGDNYWPMELSKMQSFYNKQGVLASTTVYNNKDGLGEYGFENNIAVREDGRILFYDKTRQDKRSNGVDIGFFILNKKVLDFMPKHNFSFEKEILPKLVNNEQLAGYRTDHPYYSITDIKFLERVKKFLTPKKVIFLDRDGVINKKMPPHDYVKKWEEFKFLPGAINALQLLKQNGYEIYIITNQRGISRGLMTEQDLENIHNNMKKELKSNGVELDGIYYCPHDENMCECRKPKPGMFFAAAREHFLDLTKSVLIDDSESDIGAGKAIGCKTILITPNQNLLTIAELLINNL